MSFFCVYVELYWDSCSIHQDGRFSKAADSRVCSSTKNEHRYWYFSKFLNTIARRFIYSTPLVIAWKVFLIVNMVLWKVEKVENGGNRNYSKLLLRKEEQLSLLQRRSQDPRKHLKWRALQQYLTALTRKLLFQSLHQRYLWKFWLRFYHIKFSSSYKN